MIRLTCITMLFVSLLLAGCNTGGSGGSSGEADTPTAFFQLEKREYSTGEVVRFENKSTGSDSFHWDFGDGSTSSDSSPEHVYRMAGDYFPQLTMAHHEKSLTYEYKITVTGPAIEPGDETAGIGAGTTEPTGDEGDREEGDAEDVGQGEDVTPALTAGPPAGPVQMTLKPYKVSAGSGLNYSHPSSHGLTWEFGPGETSTKKSGQHTYREPGRKLVRLTWQGDGQRVVLDSQIIQVFRASVTPRELNVENEITFKAEADFGTRWDFGEGQVLDVSEGTAMVNVPGNMNIKLVDAESGRTLKSFNIKVKDVMRPEKINALLLALADHGKSRQEKNALKKELESYCLKGAETPVTGIPVDDVDGLVIKVQLEASEYVTATIQTELELNDAGKITRIHVKEYTLNDIK